LPVLAGPDPGTVVFVVAPSARPHGGLPPRGPFPMGPFPVGPLPVGPLPLGPFPAQGPKPPYRASSRAWCRSRVRRCMARAHVRLEADAPCSPRS